MIYFEHRSWIGKYKNLPWIFNWLPIRNAQCNETEEKMSYVFQRSSLTLCPVRFPSCHPFCHNLSICYLKFELCLSHNIYIRHKQNPRRVKSVNLQDSSSTKLETFGEMSSSQQWQWKLLSCKCVTILFLMFRHFVLWLFTDFSEQPRTFIDTLYHTDWGKRFLQNADCYQTERNENRDIIRTMQGRISKANKKVLWNVVQSNRKNIN